MTRTRITLICGGLVAGLTFVQSTVLVFYGYGFNIASAAILNGTNGIGDPGNAQQLTPYLAGVLIHDLIECAAFGTGIFLVVRFIRPIESVLMWRQVIFRGVLAAGFGAVVVFVVRLIEVLLATINIGPYPLGYSFTATVSDNGVQEGLFNTFGGLLSPFVSDVPLAVLACVLLKLWLVAHSATVEAKDGASASA
jgi:hypothetical protein